MKTTKLSRSGTLLLPVLLAIAMIFAVTVAACGDDSTEEAVPTEPAAADQADGEDDGADDSDHDDDAEHHEGDAHADGDAHDDGDEVDHEAAAEIVVTMNDDLTFGPDEIVVEAGQPVRLVLDNTGATLHDFTVQEIPVTHMHHEGGSTDADHLAGDGHNEFALHLALDGGEAGTLEFTPGESGEYVFHCTVPGHTENGMHGTLVVKTIE